jgi:hypothetical protein
MRPGVETRSPAGAGGGVAGTPTVALCDASDAEKETRVRTGTRRVGRCTALKRDLDVRTGPRGADEAAGDDADTLANIDTSAARDAVCAFARSLAPT